MIRGKVTELAVIFPSCTINTLNCTLVSLLFGMESDLVYACPRAQSRPPCHPHYPVPLVMEEGYIIQYRRKGKDRRC